MPTRSIAATTIRIFPRCVVTCAYSTWAGALALLFAASGAGATPSGGPGCQ